MGGSSGGGFSPSDFAKLTQAAEARLRELAQTGTHILFVCEAIDRRSLESHLKRSSVFTNGKYSLFDSKEIENAKQKLNTSSVVVAFTNEAKTADFLNAIAEAALMAKKQGIHAKGQQGALIPAKISAYRWPSMLWEDLEKMFK